MKRNSNIAAGLMALVEALAGCAGYPKIIVSRSIKVDGYMGHAILLEGNKKQMILEDFGESGLRARVLGADSDGDGTFDTIQRPKDNKMLANHSSEELRRYTLESTLNNYTEKQLENLWYFAIGKD